MRNQYKVLAEKYSQVLVEGKKPWLSPKQTATLVKNCLKCETPEDFLNTIKKYYALYNSEIRPDDKNWIDVHTVNKEINKLPFPTKDEPLDYFDAESNAGRFYQVINGAMQYLMARWSFSDSSTNVEGYKRFYLEMWKRWWKIYGTLLKAQRSLLKKNKETGINLDI